MMDMSPDFGLNAICPTANTSTSLNISIELGVGVMLEETLRHARGQVLRLNPSLGWATYYVLLDIIGPDEFPDSFSGFPSLLRQLFSLNKFSRL